jgi:serine-type D-Ala-D-Ala carboxypeptidase (penicillin-binding protein 5/6)
MSINRCSRTVLGTTFLLLILLSLLMATASGGAAAQPATASTTAATRTVAASASAAAVAQTGRASTGAAETGSASGATAAQAIRAPVALGSGVAAVPGALGATATVPGGAPAQRGSAAAAAGGDGAATGTGVLPPRVKAGAVLLADEQTGQVLFERAADRPRAMASTTKVMTALLALERLDQRRTVVIGTEPTTVGEESLELRKGERFTVHQLLVGLLVKSANDAAVALADAVDGTAAKFVGRMNQRAAQLGLRETHYVTPYGLDRPGHHTSARDLARLWEVSMRRADFRSLVSMRSGQLPGASPQRKFVNTNQLLGSYPWVVGGKTGFTDDAGRCLVASASRGGRRLVAVALGSTDAFPDVRALFDYGFSAFDWVRLARRGQAVTLAAADGAATTYQVRSDTDALVRRDLLAKLTLAPPMKLVAPGTPATTASGGGSGGRAIWILAAGQRVAPLRLASPGSVSGPGAAGAASGAAPGSAGEAASRGGVPGAGSSDGGAAVATTRAPAASSPTASSAPAANPVAQGNGSASGAGQAAPPLSRFAPTLVPPGSVPITIDPFLRRGPA